MKEGRKEGRKEASSIPFRSLPFRSIPFIPFHSLPFPYSINNTITLKSEKQYGANRGANRECGAKAAGPCENLAKAQARTIAHDCLDCPPRGLEDN